jgi:KaiC/GvpD/RAD55 family RecA-like ATPase
MMEKIPKELVVRKQWVFWKTVERDGKQTKLPFQPSGQLAKTNDPATWSQFYTIALAGDQGYEGPGFVLSADDPYVGIDIDGCRNPETKQVEPWAKEIILKLNSYSEVSPSGTGVKIFIKADWKFEGGKKCSVKAEKVSQKEPGIEVYAQLRYFAVTGQRLSSLSQTIEHRQEALDWLVAKYLTESSKPAYQPGPLSTDEQIIKRAQKYLEKVPPAVAGQRGHDRTFQAACVLVLGFGLPNSDALALLSEWNQACDPPWTQKELEHKIADAAKQPGERNYLRDKQPEEWDRLSVPRYTQFVPQQEPQSVKEIGTLEEAANAYVAELESGKKIKLISTGLSDLDDSIGGGYEPGEMIILAARPSHGKSAVALQMAHTANANGMPVVFISEEMSKRSLGKRTIQFASEIHKDEWHEQHSNLKYDLFEHFKGRAATYIVESCGTAKRAVEEIEKAVDERGVKIAIVDYAQLLRSEGKGRYEQTTNTSIALKSVTNRLGINVICLCQLSRDIESRPQFMPKLSDLKDSGQFEQDADVILFLVWPHRINSELSAEEFQVYIAKNRNREINRPALKLKFQPSRQMLVQEKKFKDGWPTSEELGFK